MSGIPSWAVRGAKVVCVNAEGQRRTAPLEAGRTYTIREVIPKGSSAHGLVPGVRLVEAINDTNPFTGEERGYVLARFRPLVSTKTEDEDLAHFRHHLHQTAPEGIDA